MRSTTRFTSTRPSAAAPKQRRRSEEGFTLAEALIAMLVLTFGLIAIFNLMIVSTMSNLNASQSSAATMLAARQMEVLRSTPFLILPTTAANTLDTPTAQWTTTTVVDGVGTFVTTWRTQAVTNTIRFIQVRTEAQGIMGRRSRAEFTAYRTCTLTSSGCPS